MKLMPVAVAVTSCLFLSARAVAQDVTHEPLSTHELFSHVTRGVLRPVEACDASCRPAQRCPKCSTFMADYQEFRLLAQRLELGDEHWEVVGPLIGIALTEAPVAPERAGALLNLTAYAPSNTTREWTRRFYAQAAEVFSDGLLIAHAELGDSFFRGELEARAKKGAVRAAAYLALRAKEPTDGNPTSGTSLEATLGVLRAAIHNGPLVERVIAAAALRNRDDGQAWTRLVTQTRARVAERLVSDDLTAARLMTLEAEFLFRVFAKDSPRSYAEGGWWGLNVEAPFWMWKSGAEEHLLTEMSFAIRAAEDWKPTRAEIEKRLGEALASATPAGGAESRHENG